MREIDLYFFEKIKRAVSADELVLPTLPEVALIIRDLIEQDDCTYDDISTALAQDASLSASFIRIANGPLYRGIDEIVDFKIILNRMGLLAVRDLVISLALQQIFKAKSKTLNKKFRATWSKSVEIAAISRLLSTDVPGLAEEQALLAGLIHDIGTLPILVMAEKEKDILMNEKVLQELIENLRGPVGKMILKMWKFPKYFIDVVSDCYDFDRKGSEKADYVDLIQVALLQGGYVDIQDVSSIEAFKKLNIEPDTSIFGTDENHTQIEQTKQCLM